MLTPADLSGSMPSSVSAIQYKGKQVIDELGVNELKECVNLSAIDDHKYAIFDKTKQYNTGAGFISWQDYIVDEQYEMFNYDLLLNNLKLDRLQDTYTKLDMLFDSIKLVAKDTLYE